MMEVLEVAHFRVALEANQFVEFHIREVLGARVSENATSKLRAEIKVIYWLVLERLLDQEKCVDQVGHTLDISIVKFWLPEDRVQVLS